MSEYALLMEMLFNIDRRLICTWTDAINYTMDETHLIMEQSAWLLQTVSL